MSHVPYTFEQIRPTRYRFFSDGRNTIEKIVDFVPLKGRNLINLGFGDLLPEGSIDDKVISNNGDIRKVLSTIVHILKHFTALHPQALIFFTGSTDERTRLYTRIIKLYYTVFRKEFYIYGIVGTDLDNETLPFDPQFPNEYLAFLIKRIN
jgi:uncharacterized protein DUF6934